MGKYIFIRFYMGENECNTTSTTQMNILKAYSIYIIKEKNTGIEISCILCVVQIHGSRIKINSPQKMAGFSCKPLFWGTFMLAFFSFHYPEWHTYSYSSCSSQLTFNLVHFKLSREEICRKGLLRGCSHEELLSNRSYLLSVPGAFFSLPASPDSYLSSKGNRAHPVSSL